MGNTGHDGESSRKYGHEGVWEIYGQIPIAITTLHPYQSTGLSKGDRM